MSTVVIWTKWQLCPKHTERSFRLSVTQSIGRDFSHPHKGLSRDFFCTLFLAKFQLYLKKQQNNHFSFTASTNSQPDLFCVWSSARVNSGRGAFFDINPFYRSRKLLSWEQVVFPFVAPAHFVPREKWTRRKGSLSQNLDGGNLRGQRLWSTSLR